MISLLANLIFWTSQLRFDRLHEMPERYDAYKVELKLNNRQKSFCARHAGTARWSYNWALRRCIDEYKATDKRPTAIDLHREIIAMKKTEEFGWLKAVSKCSPQSALRDLDQAFKNYFNSLKSGKGRARHPRFKKRKIGHGSFRLEGTFHVSAGWIQLPKIGRVRLKERDRFPTDEKLAAAGEKILSATVSERAGRWFCSIKIRREVPEVSRSENQATIGIDLGLKNVAVLSDGTIYPSHQHHRRQLKRLRILNKRVARKQKGSRNWRKAMLQYRRLHYRIMCQRRDQIHKITTDLVRRFGTIGIETLNVAGMHRARNIRKRAHDSAVYEFTRQLEYKAERAGVEVVRADMWYPSSQLCSSCGEQHRKLHLRDRTFCCPACGLSIDRDLNAARNLEALAAGAAVTACGDAVRPDFGSARVNEAGSRRGRVAR